MEKLTLWVAFFTLVVTLINGIMFFIDLYSRMGKNLFCFVLKHTKEEGPKKSYCFELFINNLKATNISIIEVSYIFIESDRPIRKQVYPCIDNYGGFLLNGYEAKIVPADFMKSLDCYNDANPNFYVRIKTSKGVFIKDNRKYSLAYKLVPWSKKSIRKIDKIVQAEMQKSM